jgi:hypothetical protein
MNDLFSSLQSLIVASLLLEFKAHWKCKWKMKNVIQFWLHSSMDDNIIKTCKIMVRMDNISFSATTHLPTHPLPTLLPTMHTYPPNHPLIHLLTNLVTHLPTLSTTYLPTYLLFPISYNLPISYLSSYHLLPTS